MEALQQGEEGDEFQAENKMHVDSAALRDNDLRALCLPSPLTYPGCQERGQICSPNPAEFLKYVPISYVLHASKALSFLLWCFVVANAEALFQLI